MTSDSASRQLALDPTQSFCVTAPAGSGKTELLTQRMLALLARVARPEQVLAITFTRKAAAEMRERLVMRLDQARRNTPVDTDHDRLTRQLALAVLEHGDRQNWLLDPEDLNLRTIDSLCSELTRQMPVLSGIGGAIEVTEFAQELYEAAVVSLMQWLDSDSSTGLALRTLLLHFDNNWERVSELLIALLNRRGDWADRLGQHDSPDRAGEAIKQTVGEVTSAVLARAEREVGTHMGTLLPLANYAFDNLGLGVCRLSNEPESLESWKNLAGILLTGTNGWRKAGSYNVKVGFPVEGKSQKADIQALLETLQSDALRETLEEIKALPSAFTEHDVGWRLVLTLSSLLPVLQAELLLVFQREAKVDYTHIALAAEMALGNDDEPTDLALRFDYRIEHILVDEFQDTSDQQFRLLRRLTRGWAEHNQSGGAPRTLFLVGDGMQSIYGFRYANVGLFVDAQERGIGDLAMVPIALKRNFRSQGALVNWVNASFARLLPTSNDVARGRVTHVEAESVIPAQAGAAVESHLFRANQGLSEAEFIGAEIAKLRSVEPGSRIAVLVRVRHHADNIIYTLKRLGIPFVGRSFELLGSRPIISDLLALCRLMANPADNVAAMALMRAPFCGLTLADIHLLLSEVEKPFCLWSVLGSLPSDSKVALLSEDAKPRLELLASALAWAENHRDRLSLAVWIEQIWLRLGGDRVSGEDERHDARRFFSLLRQSEREGRGLDVDWLQSRLAMLYAEHDSSDNPVEIMTIHKAKGLEFDYVFVPGLGHAPRGTDRALLRWHTPINEEGAQLLIAADDRTDKGAATLYHYLGWLQQCKDRAELRRLLYVAVTRARERVWLTADSGKDNAWPGENSLMGILRDVVEPYTQQHEAIHGVDSMPMDYPLFRRVAINDVAASDSIGGPAGMSWSDQDLRAHNWMERAMGTALHRALELLAERPSSSQCLDESLRAAITAELRGAGLAGDELLSAEQQVQAWITLTLEDPQGQWILQDHPEAVSEWRLAAADPEPAIHVIDRSFIDAETQHRWIIDYKTSQPAVDERLDAFLAREASHYREQLQRYRRVVEAFSPQGPLIKTGLYFPAIQRLHTVD